MKNNLEKTIVFLAALIVFTGLVSAIGVTYPQPQNIELKPGESSYFTFQIQSDDFPLACVPIVEDLQGLEIAFNQQYSIEPNQRYNVKPQIIIPKKTPVGNYKISFCIECTPVGDVAGSRIIPRICNLPITANVVSERTRPNMFEERKEIGLWVTLLIIAVILLAIIILIIVIYRIKKKQKPL